MVEKKVQKIKAQSNDLSDSESSEDEVNPHLLTSQEERVYGTIKGSAQATQAVLYIYFIFVYTLDTKYPVST